MPTLKARVKEDLRNGRLWKARDRLQGARRVDPANQWLLETLGEIYYKMGDLPAAGRVWFLTTRTGSEWEAAEAGFYDRYGRKPSSVVAALEVRAAMDRFPPSVQERLRDLQQRLAKEGRFWEPRDRPAPQISRTRRARDWLVGLAIGAVTLTLISALLIGLYNMVLFVVRAGSG